MSHEVNVSRNRPLKVLFALGAFIGLMCSHAEAQQRRTWSGMVLDARTDKPLSGVEVAAGIYGRGDPFPGYKVTTNEDGNFSVTWPEDVWESRKGGEINHYLRVRAIQQETWRARPNTGYWQATVVRSSPSRVTVRLVPRPVWIKGRVVSAEDGTPLADLMVGVGVKRPGAAEFSLVQTASVLSDAEGFFSLGPAKGFPSDVSGFPDHLFDIPANLTGKTSDESARFEKIRGRTLDDRLGSYVGWTDPGPYYEFAIGVGGAWYELPQSHIVTSIDDSLHAYAVVRVPKDPVKGQTMPADSVSSELRGELKTPPDEADPADPADPVIPTPTPTPTPATPPSPKEPDQVDRMTLQAGVRRAQPGETVTVPVWLIRGQGIASMNVNLRYDPAVATVAGNVAKGNLLGAALFEANPRESGLIRFGYAQSRDMGGTGTIAQIPFRAAGKPGDRTPLRLEVTTISSAAGATPDIATIEGEIVIVGKDGVLPGDTDGDGQLTARDAMDALKMSVGNLPVNLAADMDGDGQVTARDATLILQGVVGK